MPSVRDTLWDITTGRPQVDPAALAAALEERAEQPPLDFRTRLLIRDSLNVLCGY